ncbi:hypothetical protein HHK36_022811 [Tetracentron sinense]|uniref:DUF6737 domain-containing protein n=1 Tax=Tetracentron sinense TaxID=13715 RepID=A0A834YNH9_TETSI|nr:hypothetical protein HHK36_022811 [Tetracentron sinense]
MGAVSLFPVSLSSLLRQHDSQLQSHLSNPILSPKISSSKFKSTDFCAKTILLRSKRNDSNESVFLDENGAVDDMDGYLNHLSLEYDSVWDTKPSWCQPWTITLTGVLLIACSWVILHSVVVTTVVLSLICTWWYIFLYSYPKAYSDMIAERRKNVTTGIEDTFVMEDIRVLWRSFPQATTSVIKRKANVEADVKKGLAVCDYHSPNFY